MLRPVERALWPGDVGVGDRTAQVFQSEPVGIEPHEIGLDAHRGTDAALDRDMTDTRDLAELLRELGVDEVRELARRIAVGRERERQDRGVGRVHLGVDGRVGEVARQGRGGSVDRRLHILRRGVDVAREIEL